MSDIVDDIVQHADEPVDFDALETLFEEARHAERIEAIRRFGPSLQQHLFEAAESRPVALDDIVPPDVGPLDEVVHAGQNTLPAFRAFEKRFCRPNWEHDGEESERDVLWGYNEQTFRLLTGPGYFVAREDETTGEVCIDYREVPPRSPETWPDVRPNDIRLGRFVYAGTVDRLRRVAEGVTIGRAFEADETPMNAWFVLVRRDG